MPAAFAALESRVNVAVVGHLSNRVAVFTPAGSGVGRGIQGIFDDRYERDLEDLASGSTPAFTCMTSDVEDATPGAALTLDGITWEVVEPMPDGAGMTVLRLRRAG